ncbi:hypothetical protein Tco_0729727 [Tanacetum coccineum]|uniref:HAT C-terminal dimerisation domain-containing protein n=1 Tax=Tanacetum coccineum TaxID=301880 RepID=A0ABQ4YS47_9ASTR
MQSDSRRCKLFVFCEYLTTPLLQALAFRVLDQPTSSSCSQRNWSTYSFVNSLRRNKLTPKRAEDLVFVHNNLRLLSRSTEQYLDEKTKMWDVGGDEFGTMEDTSFLELAQLSLDEPELESVFFSQNTNYGFLDSGGRKNNHRKKTDNVTGTGSVTESDGILNVATPLVDAVAAKEVVSPSMVDETVVKEKPSSLVDTNGLGSYLPLPTQETTTAGNTPCKSSYANVTGKPSGTKVNFRTLFTPGANGIDEVVLVESIRAISE